jgi:hypothetical protein
LNIFTGPECSKKWQNPTYFFRGDDKAEYKEKASEKKENKPKVVYVFHCDLRVVSAKKRSDISYKRLNYTSW